MTGEDTSLLRCQMDIEDTGTLSDADIELLTPHLDEIGIDLGLESPPLNLNDLVQQLQGSLPGVLFQVEHAGTCRWGLARNPDGVLPMARMLMDSLKLQAGHLPEGVRPVTFAPFSGAGTRISVLDGTPGEVLRRFELLLDQPISPASRALLEVGVIQQQRGGDQHLAGLVTRIQHWERTVLELVTEYQDLHDPLREDGLLSRVLGMMLPGVDLADLEVRSVTSAAPYDLPPNPWSLLAEGDEDGAEALLRAALEWTPKFSDQARVVLHAWT